MTGPTPISPSPVRERFPAPYALEAKTYFPLTEQGLDQAVAVARAALLLGMHLSIECEGCGTATHTLVASAVSPSLDGEGGSVDKPSIVWAEAY